LEQKEKEIESLQQERELQQTALEIKDARLRQQQLVLYSALIGLILISIVAYVIYTYYKKVYVLNAAIAEQKEEIQAQAEELIEANETIADINKRLEVKVEDRTHQLRQAYKELDTFFYRSSHDFRRPLTTFMGLAEVAKITLKDESALELFAKVKETAIGLDKMLTKLQSVSDVGAQELLFKEIFLKEIFLNVIEAAREKLDEKNINAVSRVDIREPIYSYPVLIKTITENLLENAIIFSLPENGRVELNAWRENGALILEVKDNGIGMEEDIMAKIFDMYFRGSDRSKGNGLGLFIVKKAVEKLGGQIEVTSRPGTGSTFRVMLPKEPPTG
jgi:signal transduction histidine kinase